MSQRSHSAAPRCSIRRLVLFGFLLCFVSAGTSFAQPCLPPVFNSPPTSITAYTTANTCTPLVSFLARLVDSTGVSFSFVRSGATTGSGTGTGSGLTFNRGITHVVITAKKACDSTKHFLDIIVRDTIKPVMSTLPNITVYATPNLCGANVNFPRPTVTDNCPDCTSSLLIALGFKPLGTFQGHSYYTTPLKANFDLVNAQASTFGAHLVSINSKAEDSFIAAMLPDTQLAWIGITDRDSEGVWKWTDGSPVTYTNWCGSQPDDFLGGQDWALLNSSVPGQNGSCWDDAHSPIFPGNGQPNNFVGVVELDACRTSFTQPTGPDSGGFFRTGTTTVEFGAVDASGNVAISSFKVTVIDTVKPKLSGIANITAYAGPNQCGANVSYRRPTVTDNCKSCSDAGKVSSIDTNEFVYKGDYNGHSYLISKNFHSWQSASEAALNSDPKMYLISINDFGEDEYLHNVLVPDTSVPIWIGLSETSPNVWRWESTEPVTYTNWCTNSIPPQPDNYLLDQNFGLIHSDGTRGTEGCWDDGHSPISKVTGEPNKFLAVAEIVPTPLTNCLVLTRGVDSGGFFPLGATIVTWKATDIHGNVDSISFTVTVLDTVKPKFTPQPNITVFAAPRACGANVNYTINATDNCPGCSNFNLLTSLGFKQLGQYQGHTYFTTPLKANFDLVNAQALGVLGSHLVSINSRGEDSFIAAALPDTQIAWIGFTDRDVEGVWKWTDGSPVTYTNWCTSQPDDFLGDQDWAILNSGGIPGPTGCWDDAHSPVFKGNGAPNNFVGIIELDTCRSVLTVRTSGFASGAFFPRGTTTVTYKAIDANGNVDSIKFTVTVIDTLCTTITGNFGGNIYGGISNSSSDEVRVYPNPTSNTFYVELPYFEKAASVNLMDMQGRLLQSRSLSTKDNHRIRFDLGSHPRGMYMVDVTYDDHRYRVRVTMQ